MTLENTAPFISYKGNGIAKTFPIPFPAMDKDDLVFSCRTASGDQHNLVKGTDYAIRPEKYMPNTLTVEFAKPFPADWILDICRQTPIVQESALHNQGPSYPKTIELGLDRLTMICQELSLSMSDLPIPDLLQRQQELASAIESLEKAVKAKVEQKTFENSLAEIKSHLAQLMTAAPDDGRLYAASGNAWQPVDISEGGDPFMIDTDNLVVPVTRKQYSPNPLWHIGPSHVSLTRCVIPGDGDSLFTVDSEGYCTVKI